MPINSREKGARGELEFCRVCHNEGYRDVHRTAQHSGKTGQCADVKGLPGIHVEVKRNERLNIHDAIAQSVRDSVAAGKGDLPIVAHRKNHSEWLITMRAEDWFKLYREWRL